MKTHQSLPGLLIAVVMIATFGLVGFARETCGESATIGALDTFPRAELQAQGQGMALPACASRCSSDGPDPVASYERARLQAQGERMNEVAPDPNTVSETRDRAELQAQGQRWSLPESAICEMPVAAMHP